MPSGPSTDTTTKPADEAKEWDAKAAVNSAFDLLDQGQDDDSEDDEELDSSNEEEQDDDSEDESEDDGDDAEGSDEDEEDESEDDEDTDETETEQHEDAETERDIGFAKSIRFRKMNEELKALRLEKEEAAAAKAELAKAKARLAVVEALENPTAPGALKLLEPHLARLVQINGQGPLDEDLQKAVENSDLSEPYARQLQAARAQEKFRETAQRETAQQRSQNEAAEALGGLYREFEKSDPDFGKKREMVESFASVRAQAFYQATGRKPTIAEGLAMVKEAKAKVDALAPAKPKASKPESRVVSSGSKAAKKPGALPKQVSGEGDIRSIIDDVMRRVK